MEWKKGDGILSGIEKDLNLNRGELGPPEGLVNCIEILMCQSSRRLSSQTTHISSEPQPR
jgi:hypothetical protein